ncbi:hypothetical protein IFR05_005302 [Cadophora sp. M221]|nr:hypothetical protein IFR05_005302 [Cadophora sp. M221]
MPWEERLEVIRTLVGYEKAFVSANLPMYGSLYYAKDLPSPSPSQLLDSVNSINKGEEAFVVGPTTNRAFFDQGRDSVEVNRGPWPSLNEFVHSRAARELACVDKFSSYPGQQGLFSGPNQYRPTRSLKVGVLQDYLKVATQILPNDSNLILNIIDWQAVNVSPLFLQARHPSLIEFEGPIPEGFEPITLPGDFEDMSEEAQHQAKNLRAAQSLYKLYEILMLRQCPEIAHALHFRDTLPGQITGLASSVFSDGEPILQGILIRLHDETQQQRLEASWSEGVELKHEILTEIDAYQGWDGWVNHTNYSVYKERLARCRENFLDRYAKTEEERSQWIQAWPFDDKTTCPLTSL